MKRLIFAACLLFGFVAASSGGLLVGSFSSGSAPPPTYATWNASDIAANLTLSNGNLTIKNTSGSGSISYRTGRATVGKSSGKWYWEITVNDMTNTGGSIGVAASTQSLTNFIGASGQSGWGYQASNGNCNSNGGTSYGASWTTGDVIGVALNMDAGTVTFYKNGTSQGTIESVGCTSVTGTVYPAITLARDSQQYTANFGASAFTYSVPSGYNAGVF